MRPRFMNHMHRRRPHWMHKYHHGYGHHGYGPMIAWKPFITWGRPMHMPHMYGPPPKMWRPGPMHGPMMRRPMGGPMRRPMGGPMGGPLPAGPGFRAPLEGDPKLTQFSSGNGEEEPEAEGKFQKSLTSFRICTS